MSDPSQVMTGSDEQARLDQAIRCADDLLVASLKQDERRRRRWRGIWFTAIMGGFLMVTAYLISLALSAAVPAGNVLQNPGLEEGDKAPAHWSQGAPIEGVQYLWDKQIGQEGKASLCLHKTANRYFPLAYWYQTVEHKGGAGAIKVSAQVKAQSVTKAIIDVIFLDDKGEWIKHEWASYIGPKQEGAPAFTHDWKVYSGSVKIPAGTKQIQVALQIYGPGKVWFDAVRAEYAK